MNNSLKQSENIYEKSCKNACMFQIFFVTLHLYKYSGFDHGIHLIFKPFKTLKVMNKTVKKIFQVISYVISALLGAFSSNVLS